MSITTLHFSLLAWTKFSPNNFNFSIIEECSEEQLNKREKYWIKYYNSYGKNGYNLTSGGEGYLKVPPE